MQEPIENDPDYILRTQRKPHEGLPPLSGNGPTLSFFEFWPGWRFYPPLVAYCIFLSIRYGGLTLPTVVNPTFDHGGVVGESKTRILDLIARSPSAHLVASYVSIVNQGNLQLCLQALQKAGLSFPLVAKPDNGCRGVGIQPIYSEHALQEYLSIYPKGERVILQQLVNYEAEAGIFYVRHPDQEKGEILSLTLKYFPYVIGDGVSTLKELIEKDSRAGALSHIYLPRHQHRLEMILPAGQHFRIAFAGSHSRGSIFKDGSAYITEAMRNHFDKIAKDIPEFYFGRFDVRFEKMEDLETGKNLRILEINGATGEMTHIWDSRTTLINAYKDLMNQYKHLYQIGAKNRRRGFKPSSVADLWKEYRKYKQLIAVYPMTH